MRVTGVRRCIACGSPFDSSDKEATLCRYCENALERMEGYAVLVVRCKDCKYYKQVKGAVGGWCDCELTPFDMDPNDFCSLGERKNDEQQ